MTIVIHETILIYWLKLTNSLVIISKFIISQRQNVFLVPLFCYLWAKTTITYGKNEM